MKTVFSEILSVCAEAGLVRVGDVYLDGTKIKGKASLWANRTVDQLDKEIEQMLEEARVADEEDDRRFGPTRRGDELPEELEDPGRLRFSTLLFSQGREEVYGVCRMGDFGAQWHGPLMKNLPYTPHAQFAQFPEQYPRVKEQNLYTRLLLRSQAYPVARLCRASALW